MDRIERNYTVQLPRDTVQPLIVVHTMKPFDAHPLRFDQQHVLQRRDLPVIIQLGGAIILRRRMATALR